MSTQKDEHREMYLCLVVVKLHRHKYIGKRHTNEDNIPKGFPPVDREYIKDALDELIKRGVVISKPTSYGKEVSLNPRYPELLDLIEDCFEKIKEYNTKSKSGL